MEESNKPRRRIIGLLGLATVAATVIALQTKRYLETPPIPDRAGSGRELRIDASDSQRVERGRQLYAQACAACHGAKLEGQPNWRDRLPSGRLPAPPHDASGHTWHHADAILFSLTKNAQFGRLSLALTMNAWLSCHAVRLL